MRRQQSGKRVVIKIGSGSIQTGYVATVQIGDEGLPPRVETEARLSAAPDLPALYACWQQAYRRLGLPYRLEAISGETNVSRVSEVERCRQLSRQIRLRVHDWLNDESFRPIREKVLEQLSPQDTVRILLQTQDPLLQRLPWYDLEIFQRYRQAEVVICFPQYQQVHSQGSCSAQVRVLAVLGNSRGLDTESDCALLSQLPNADVKILKGPSIASFNHELWDSQGWDILFFAGHSQSRENCGIDGEGRGELLLNETEVLSMTQLKHALRKAIERGLGTAIFNSCDGLGLASDLADLHIPQVLVMREPVPDEVAQAFLKGFLASFSRDVPFYVAVREARERLEGLESRFPCATWLPVIVQNLAEMPPTWQSLQRAGFGSAWPSGRGEVRSGEMGSGEVDASCGFGQGWGGRSRALVLSSAPLKRRVGLGVVAAVGAAAIALGLRFLGVLEPLELRTYDFLLRSRPTEDVDRRLLIVTNTAEDIRAYPNLQGQSSLADDTLSALLEKLNALDPQGVGLDIYRDYPARNAQLARQLVDMDNLVFICKIEEVSSGTEARVPPPEIQSLSAERNNRVGASDFVSDVPNGVVRRHLMALSGSRECSTNTTFSTQLAWRYVQETLNVPVTDDRSFGAARLPMIDLSEFGGRHFGGYHDVDAAGTQILLNYRIVREAGQTNCGGVLETPAICISVSDFLTRSPSELEALVNRKIVLIGTTDTSFGDTWITPYTTVRAVEGQTPGVFLQAQMISQLVSAAKGERALLTSWPLLVRVFWTVAWAMVGGFVAVGMGGRRPVQTMLLRLFLAMGLLVLSSWLWLVVVSVWVPLIPSAIALSSAAGIGFVSRAVERRFD